MNKRNPEAFKKAIEYFSHAIEKEPDYANPYPMLVQTYALAANFGVLPDSEIRRQAQAAALKGVSLDGMLSESHVAAATVANREWNWNEAGNEYARAIELNPNYAYVHSYYSNYLSNVGRVEEAVQQARQAEMLDPLSRIIGTTVGSRLYCARRYTEAIAQCRKTLELEPNFAVTHYDLARAYEQAGLLQQAISEAEKQLSSLDALPCFLEHWGMRMRSLAGGPKR